MFEPKSPLLFEPKKFLLNEKTVLIRGYLQMLIAANVIQENYKSIFVQYKEYVQNIWNAMLPRFQYLISKGSLQKESKTFQTLICYGLYYLVVPNIKMKYKLNAWNFIDIIKVSNQFYETYFAKTKGVSSVDEKKIIKKKISIKTSFCNCQCRTMLFASLCENFGLLGSIIQVNLTYQHMYVSIKSTKQILELTSQKVFEKQYYTNQNYITIHSKNKKGKIFLEKRTSNVYYILMNQLLQLESLLSTNTNTNINLKKAYESFVNDCLVKLNDKSIKKNILLLLQSFYEMHVLSDGSNKKTVTISSKQLNRDFQLQYLYKTRLLYYEKNYYKNPIHFYMSLMPHINIKNMISGNVLTNYLFFELVMDFIMKKEDNDMLKRFHDFMITIVAQSIDILIAFSKIHINNSLILGFFNVDYQLDHRNHLRHRIVLTIYEILKLFIYLHQYLQNILLVISKPKYNDHNLYFQFIHYFYFRKTESKQKEILHHLKVFCEVLKNKDIPFTLLICQKLKTFNHIFDKPPSKSKSSIYYSKDIKEKFKIIPLQEKIIESKKTKNKKIVQFYTKQLKMYQKKLDHLLQASVQENQHFIEIEKKTFENIIATKNNVN